MHTCAHTYTPTYIPNLHIIYIVIFTGIEVIFKYISICVYVCVCMHAKFHFIFLHSLSYSNSEKRWQKNLNVFCIIISLSKTLTFSYVPAFLQNSCSKNINNFSFTNVCFVHPRNSSDLNSEHNSFMFM